MQSSLVVNRDRKKAQDWPGDTSNFRCQEDEKNLAKKTEILGEVRGHGFLKSTK